MIDGYIVGIVLRFRLSTSLSLPHQQSQCASCVAFGVIDLQLFLLLIISLAVS